MKIRIVGIDFSGAKNAGKHIWIAAGSTLEHLLHINEVKPAANLPASGNDRATCYDCYSSAEGIPRWADCGSGRR